MFCRSCAHAHESLPRELERVGGEIDQYLLNSRVIPYKQIGRVQRYAFSEAQMRALGFRFEQSNQVIHENVQVQRGAFNKDLSRFDLAQIQQVVDKRAKLSRRGQQPIHELALLLSQI